MERTLIQQYATGIVKGLMEQVKAIGPLDHAPTKGRLRELFVTQVLSRFLTSQFGVGSGVITNQWGDQSNETDIIIYDNRILMPFIREESIGVFPVEAVVETIEVKSRLGTKEILEAEANAQRLRQVATTGTIYAETERPRPPGTTIIGFAKHGLSDVEEEGPGKAWLAANVSHLWGICAVGTLSWMRVAHAENPWALQRADEHGEEIKRFVGVVLDNARTRSERNYHQLAGQHHDWIGVYIRKNSAVRRVLDDSRQSEK